MLQKNYDQGWRWFYRLEPGVAAGSPLPFPFAPSGLTNLGRPPFHGRQLMETKANRRESPAGAIGMAVMPVPGSGAIDSQQEWLHHTVGPPLAPEERRGEPMFAIATLLAAVNLLIRCCDTSLMRVILSLFWGILVTLAPGRMPEPVSPTGTKSAPI